MKTAIFYYTQSGQARAVAESIGQALPQAVYKPIRPLTEYPFPWSKDEFFNAFPESRLGLPPGGIEAVDFADVEDADLVLLVGQSWFLSPSLPLQSFLADEAVRQYLHGRSVVFVNACRNMWLMTMRRVRQLLDEAGARLVGHIVVQDERPNLVSVLTVIRWLMYGRKERSLLLPDAGIKAEDVAQAALFGTVIREAWQNAAVSDLQRQLVAVGAVNYKPSVLMLERLGHRTFGLWARFVRQKGGFGDRRRRRRLNCFYAYLLFALFCVSPFVQALFYLTYPLQRVGRHRREDCLL